MGVTYFLVTLLAVSPHGQYGNTGSNSMCVPDLIRREFTAPTTCLYVASRDISCTAVVVLVLQDVADMHPGTHRHQTRR